LLESTPLPERSQRLPPRAAAEVAADVGAILTVVAPNMNRLRAAGVRADIAVAGAILCARWIRANSLLRLQDCRGGVRDAAGDRGGRAWLYTRPGPTARPGARFYARLDIRRLDIRKRTCQGRFRSTRDEAAGATRAQLPPDAPLIALEVCSNRRAAYLSIEIGIAANLRNEPPPLHAGEQTAAPEGGRILVLRGSTAWTGSAT
jgi:hypothetical protein